MKQDPPTPNARHSHKRIALVDLPLVALVVTLVVELFNHKAFTDGLESFGVFVTEHPLALFTDFLIVLATLTPAVFLRRRVFYTTLMAILWLIGGAANGFILLNRMTPFTMADLTVLNSGLDTLPNYLSTGYIVLLAVAVGLTVVVLALLFWKGPRNQVSSRRRLYGGILAMLMNLGVLCCVWAAAFQTNQLSTVFSNLATAYEDYGFSYCFLQTWLNKGISQPMGYGSRSVERVESMVEKLAAEAQTGDPQTDVNVIYVQLESFIDPSLIQGLTLSEDPVPNWTALSEQYSTGALTVPVVGAGTANTECEVLTGMSTRFFGPGEYPYETRLRDRTVESVAYDLKEAGYAAHAIHNHNATFYSRNEVYANLGFDDFTALEYMPQVKTTPQNWAKDEILTGQILKALNTTPDQADLVFTVSVQGHGKYPLEPVLENPEISVLSCPDERFRYAAEYYVNQVHEMDAFIGALTDALEQREERSVLVLYGDHLPALGLEASDMESGTLFSTEYIIWDNFGLEKRDQDLTAYQLTSEVLGRLNITNGVINQFHQFCREQSTYRRDLELLQYDVLYGKKYLYDGQMPYEPSQMQLGMSPIEIQRLFQLGGEWYVSGENFSPYCRVMSGSRQLDTVYLSAQLLKITEDPETENAKDLSIRVVDKHNEILTDTAEQRAS